MTKVWELIKQWGLAVIGFIAGLFLLVRKPRWIKEKEREIKDRDKQIGVAKEQADQTATTYKEVMANHDEAIEQAGQTESKPGFTDPDNAASFIDDILGERKGK